MRKLFLIGVNDKNAADQVSQVADIVKENIGKNRVIILWENEKLIL